MSSADKNPGECESCGYETQELHWSETTNRIHIENGTAGFWICDVCYETLAGNALDYPRQYESGDTLRMIAYCTNLILDRLEIRKDVR